MHSAQTFLRNVPLFLGYSIGRCALDHYKTIMAFFIKVYNSGLDSSNTNGLLILRCCTNAAQCYSLFSPLQGKNDNGFNKVKIK